MINLVTQYYLRSAGGVSRPVFHDIDQVCPELRRLENNFSVIRSEVEAILPKKSQIPRYHEADSGRSHISNKEDPDHSWRVFMLYVMGAKPAKNRATCPRTTALVDQMPDLFQSFFSILEPQTSIPMHSAPYGGYLRYHLPLIVPTDSPPQLRINGQGHTWREREGVLFDDTWNHEVLNESNSIRVVLVVDVLRPMPRLADQVNRAFTKCVLRPFYGQPVSRKTAVEKN